MCVHAAGRWATQRQPGVLRLTDKSQNTRANSCPATMFIWRTAIISLFYCYIKMSITCCQTKGLFTVVRRSKRGGAAAANTTFYNSFSDVHLLFEILLTGITFEPGGEVSVHDAELASLRKTQNLKVICEEIVPRKPSDVLMFVSHLSNKTKQLSQDDFERTLLTLVYLAQQMVSSMTNYQQDMWAESFVSLYEIIKQDLMR
uniref:Family with sequence similarity 180 member A n=1 Tax=Cynoglossus semilaevis TaxID=244447 RepID=A0A3P8UXP5_CYNSE